MIEVASIEVVNHPVLQLHVLLGHRLLRESGGFVRYLVAPEIEVNLVDPPADAVDLRLPGDAVELAAAADHVDPVVVALKIALDADIADTADLSVQVNDRTALDMLISRDEPAAVIATDPVVAVLGIEELVLEANGVVRSLGPTSASQAR